MKNVIYWCEFPETVDWKALQKLLEKMDYSIKIYIPCKTESQFIWWRQQVKKLAKNIKEVNVWPILEKEEGYWFSGFTEVHNIDKLERFNGYKLKIDLEMPFKYNAYSFWKAIGYLMTHMFKKGPNSSYLENKIFQLNSTSEILVNEFPLPKLFLKRWGCSMEAKKGIKKNIMCYSSMFPRFWIKHYMKKHFRKNKDISVSLGLIGHGILKKEPVYSSVKQLEKDIQLVNKIGIKNIAIYSIDSIMKRENPEEWLRAIREFSQS